MLFAAPALALAPLLASARGGRGTPGTKRSDPVKRLTWTRAQNYAGQNFLSGWDFYLGSDASLTGGLVNYVHRSDLAYYDSKTNSTILRVDDTTNIASGAYRDSTRITSKASVNENSLVIADFTHVPFGCATWPAFWLVGPNWPHGGEMDIFEGVNLNTLNQATLHTTPGCYHDASQPQTGRELQSTCDTNVNGNAGCGVQDTRTTSYGNGFNNNGGGVFATQWDTDGVSIWFFPRGQVPSDVASGHPNPSGWGTPMGFWSFKTGKCNNSFFQPQQAVFDITLCGGWAGGVYGSSGCPGSCNDQVAKGSNFQNAYFQVNYVSFYTGA